MSEPGAPPAARERVTLALMAPVLDAARGLGVAVDEAQALARGAVWGEVEGVRIAMGIRFLAGRAAGYAHFAEVEEPVVGPVTVEPWTGLARGRQPSGDPVLDRALAVHGDPPVVRALLDEASREVLVALFAPLPRPVSLQIARRKLTFRGPETMAVEPERVQADLRRLIQLANALRLSRRTLLERVVVNALEDSEAEVRERNAAVLGELMSTSGPEARYGAAVRLLRSDEISLDHRLDILRIVRSMPAERIRPLMHLLLEEGSLELARRAVGWVRETRSGESMRHLVRALHRFDDVSLARSVAEAMAATRDPKAQPTLLNMLNREDDGLRTAVIEALGHVGTRDATAAIQPFTKGLFLDRELKRAAREALDRIEARAAAPPSAAASDLDDLLDDHGHS